MKLFIYMHVCDLILSFSFVGFRKYHLATTSTCMTDMICCKLNQIKDINLVGNEFIYLSDCRPCLLLKLQIILWKPPRPPKNDITI